MATYLEIAKAAQSEDLRLRVQAACFVTARALITGPPPGNAQDTRRQQLARNIVGQASGPAFTLFVWAVATAPAVANTISTGTGGAVVIAATDAQVQTAVEGAWDAVAGWSAY